MKDKPLTFELPPELSTHHAIKINRPTSRYEFLSIRSQFSIESIVARVDLSLFQVPIALYAKSDAMGSEWLVVELRVRDRDGGADRKIASQFAVEFPFQTEMDAIRWVFSHVAWMVNHELMESFVVGGCRVFDPHDVLAAKP